MNNLFLGVSRGLGIEAFDKKKINKNSKKSKCDFCGIGIGDDAHDHEKDGELYSSCSLCYYSEHLDKIVSMKKGSIILMPEMTQVELNSLVRLIWYYQSIEEEEFLDKIDTIENLYSQIKERENFVESYYSEGASDIDVVINALFNFKDDKYKQRERGMYGLLWLPEKDFFKEDILRWNVELSQKYPPSAFKDMIQSMKNKAEGNA